MRYENFAPKEYYHVFSRGVNKEKIFIDDYDRARFIFLLTHFQSPARVYNVAWHTKYFIKNKRFKTDNKKTKELLGGRNIELVAFALMPNHFHILVRNLDDGILSVYMHRVLTAYSKYFNARYNKKGHVFHGPFGAVHIKNNTQLLHLSAYIHKNPKAISGWESTYDRYPFSSYQDYISINRWGDFLSPNILLKQFKVPAEYEKFVTESPAKEPNIEDF